MVRPRQGSPAKKTFSVVSVDKEKFQGRTNGQKLCVLLSIINVHTCVILIPHHFLDLLSLWWFGICRLRKWCHTCKASPAIANHTSIHVHHHQHLHQDHHRFFSHNAALLSAPCLLVDGRDRIWIGLKARLAQNQEHILHFCKSPFSFSPLCTPKSSESNEVLEKK